ncbi:hypothetical protein A2688_03885 [Candidatus Daviesbacteria bacterium RIFCSPHIGHO2_01_FULL_38_8]|nr:MAG: hypothetical protein A2688_03885 [Candidatus Daviesbacteria bacterium RIFCSPHIGHO2_01_FULL_38_8]
MLQLTQRAIKERYKQSIIGYAWVLLNPLLQLLIYAFVFSVVFRFPLDNVPYPLFLFVGLLPWIYLQNTLTVAALSLVDNSDLLRKVNFPRETLPYSVIFAKAVDFIFASLLFLTFIFYYQQPLYLTALWIFPLFIIQIILMTGLSLLVSCFNLFYRDIQHLTNLILLMWMYLTPIVYPLSMVPKNWVYVYKLNPLVGIIEGYRSAIFNTAFDTGAILWSFVFSFIILIAGYLIFKKTEKVFADIV